MRSPAYVAIVTSIYRKALDAIRTGTFQPNPEDIADLAIAFSRGFTTGYISGLNIQKSWGVPIQATRDIIPGLSCLLVEGW